MQYERIEEYIEGSKAVYKCMNEKSLWTFDAEEVWTFDVEWKNLQRCSIYISIYILIDIFFLLSRDVTRALFGISSGKR